MQAKSLIWKTKRYYKKRVLQVHYVDTKAVKCVNSTLYGGTEKKKKTAENLILSVFTLLFTKTQKCMESILYEERKGHYEKHIL